MTLRPEILDRNADTLRRAHLRQSGVDPKHIVAWRSLQPSEQQTWRERASTTRHAH